MKRELRVTSRQARTIRARGTVPPPLATAPAAPAPEPELALTLALELDRPIEQVVVVQSRRTLAAYDDAAPAPRWITSA